ncbi:competence protein ComFA [Bacillus oleivorans]|uniref:Competence protein ComFA n=1 Tax=Bacillus oleivorans TaxID=1448271 RepID=A0A285CZE6_9BACI|nr:DEAD/DEAH box helicase [Bacillus oleivorans]SNX72934.1 competence protein ComFA [Bacillus oleivorans]
MNVPQKFEDLQLFLSGRVLLKEELAEFETVLNEAKQEGLVALKPGVTEQGGSYHCNRCGNKKRSLFYKMPCARCGKECAYCRACIRMGRVSACSSLYTWRGQEPLKEPFSLQWEGELSPAQQNAANKVVEAVKSKSNLLVWAVCGAGKTEILFQGIEAALQLGERVCVATPRTDVVLELLPRLQAAFPDTKVVGLYGGSEDRHVFSPLVVSTTHQLYRFEKAFDTVIIDEVDAFPFSADETLQHAVKKAQKEGSSTIYLSATPNTTFQSNARKGSLPSVQIPARYHGHPLPVPTFYWIGNWKKVLQRNQIPATLLKWINSRLKSEKPILLFFPHIKLMEEALPQFKSLHPKIEAVHAEDPNRKEKVQAMRDHTTPMLLTTTILERGVTFPNLDVAVLGAEERIFTESALVQIAGRVGRSPVYPSGEVAFFHYGKTEEMVKARKHIEKMNRLAKKEGYLL